MWIGAAIFALAYLLGGCCAGYYLVRSRIGVDVRTLGSGAVGATNVGRVLGRSGFVWVAVLDFAKGVLAVAVAHLADLEAAWCVSIAFAVVFGHVFPLQLGFRGGKGIATATGAWLVVEPLALLAVATVFLPVFAVVRRFTAAGLVAWAFAPLLVWWWCGVDVKWGGFVAVVGLILVSHRAHLRGILVGLRAPRREPAPPATESSA